MNGTNKVYCNALISIIVMLTLCLSQNPSSTIPNNNPEYEARETVMRMIYRMLYIPDYRVAVEETSFMDDYTLALKNLSPGDPQIELLRLEFERQVWDFMKYRFSDICTEEVIGNFIRSRFPLSTSGNMRTYQHSQFIEDVEIILLSSDDIVYRYKYTAMLRREYESESESVIARGRIYVKLLDGKFVVITCPMPAFFKAN